MLLVRAWYARQNEVKGLVVVGRALTIGLEENENGEQPRSGNRVFGTTCVA